MRLRQFGHQVPRRNSIATAPREMKSESEKIPARFADESAKAGAIDPVRSVSVELLKRFAPKWLPKTSKQHHL
jgi:hypothetical protein